MKQRFRKNLRLKDYDYSQEGYYFITICTHFKAHILGQVVGDATKLTPAGTIVQSTWEAIPKHFINAEIDAFVVMPNHVHGILHLTSSGGAFVPGIIQTFKSTSTRRINRLRATQYQPVWQRNYFERIIRTERTGINATLCGLKPFAVEPKGRLK
jgi:REP element-mobilizing transposase RayT